MNCIVFSTEYQSLLVCAGIILSLFAERYAASWLYYADAVASIVIGCLIFKSGIELLIELIKPGAERINIYFLQTCKDCGIMSLIISCFSSSAIYVKNFSIILLIRYILDKEFMNKEGKGLKYS